MRIYYLIIIFCISICLSCSSNRLFQSWIPIFIEEDTKLNEPLFKSAYGITFKFINDTTIVYHNIKSDIKASTNIKYISDTRFKILNTDHKYFHCQLESISKDSLIIKYVSNIKNEKGFLAKYITLPESEIESSINELKFILINNLWEYEIDDWKYELEFNYSKKEDRGWFGNYKTGYTCIMHFLKMKNTRELLTIIGAWLKQKTLIFYKLVIMMIF